MAFGVYNRIPILFRHPQVFWLQRGIRPYSFGRLSFAPALAGLNKGMISSFSVIAMSGVALEASKVAEGISEALVITFEGVLLSVPAIFLYSIFKNRISQISVETTMLADDCLRSIYRLLKPKTGSA